MSRHGDAPDLLEAAVRAELLAEDMRVSARAAGPAPAAQCVCDGVQCDEDKCAHCAALDPSLPCPSDAVHPLTAQSFGAMVGPAGSPEIFPPAALPVPRPAVPTCDTAGHDHSTSSCLGPVVETVPAAAPAPVPPAAVGPSSRPYTWASRHDPVSFADYHVRDRLAGKAPLRDLLLPLPAPLDQGRDGDCVGFGCVDAARILDLIRVPGAAELPGPADAVALYTAARKIDGEATTDPAGTSVLAGMKAGQADGYWGGYLWADGTSAIAQAMLQLHVPAVVGVPWHEAMETPGAGGVLRVAGGITGGHCVVVCGITLRGPNGEPGPWFRLLNSWGAGWGAGGCGWIFHRDLAALLHDEGEAAIPTAGTA